MELDLLVLGAHPDDAELAAGGLIARTVRAGHRVGVLDLTRGEMGSRGSPEIREREAREAARVLGLACRENLGLPDGGLTASLENRRLVAEAYRRFRPALVAAPHPEDLHPDHAAAGRLAEEAFYPAGFARYRTEGPPRGAAPPPYRPLGLIHYMNHTPFRPSFILDIGEVWRIRLEAIRCFASQLHREGSAEPRTNISSPDFLDRLDARLRHYGSLIGASHGEPYWTRRPPPMADPLKAYRRD